MGLARRLLGAQAAPGRSMGCAWLGPWAARRLGSRRRLLALSGVLRLPRISARQWLGKSGLAPDRRVKGGLMANPGQEKLDSAVVRRYVL